MKVDEDCLTYQKCDVESGLCYFPEEPDNTQNPDNNTEIPDENDDSVTTDNEINDEIIVLS